MPGSAERLDTAPVPNDDRDDESAAASGRLVTGECDAGLVGGLGLTRIMAGAWAA